MCSALIGIYVGVGFILSGGRGGAGRLQDGITVLGKEVVQLGMVPEHGGLHLPWKVAIFPEVGLRSKLCG